MMNKKEYISPKISPVIIDKEIILFGYSNRGTKPGPFESNSVRESGIRNNVKDAGLVGNRLVEDTPF